MIPVARGRFLLVRRAVTVAFATALALGAWGVSSAAGKGEPGTVVPVRIELRADRADVTALLRMGIDVDGVFGTWLRAYVLPEERAKLEGMGYRISDLPSEVPPAEQRAAYHTYATLTADLQALAAAHPSLARLYSMGQSVQGRELWVMKITDNPDVEEDEPEVAYISSMHGDEVVGKELCIYWIQELLDNYATDPEIRDFVDETEIWVMPSMNPDGTENGGRYNANGHDLNRNFPDQFDDPVNTVTGRQPETIAVMEWTKARSINLKANMHGGALVANYPYDSNPQSSYTFSPTADPDHPMFFSLARTYADNNVPMSQSNSDSSFDDGVCNGAEWYPISGGMQDWSYVWYGTMEITLEVSNVKWPSDTQLPGFWDDNRESMLAYIQRVHEGVRGLVTDAVTGAPVAAEVRIDANPVPTYSDPDVGDYHRMLLQGSYSMEISAPGYQPQTIPITVVKGGATRYDVALQPMPTSLEWMESRIDAGAGGDGWLDPGETADLAVTLRNMGQTATSVQARLEPTGWDAAVLRDEADYPDLDLLDMAESNAPHFEIAVDPGTPAGRRLGFAVHWQSDQAQGVSGPFFLELGAPTGGSYPSADVPVSILDFQTATSDLTITAGGTIADVEVAVNLSHTYIGDLVVSVRSPSGTEVTLHNRSGGSSNNIVGTYGVDLSPAGNLGDWNGESSAGTWQLVVSDQAGGDTGSIVGWSLEIEAQAAETVLPEMRFRDLERQGTETRLRWWPYPDLTSYRIYRSAGDPSSSVAFIEVTGNDADPTDTEYLDTAEGDLVYYLVTGEGAQGEGPKGHFGE